MDEGSEEAEFGQRESLCQGDRGRCDPLSAWRKDKSIGLWREWGELEGRTSEQTGGRAVREGRKVQTGPEDDEGRASREAG